MKIGHEIGNIQPPRTSQSHPLRIAVVEDSPFQGLLGLTFAPGKKDLTSSPSPWLRNLTADLDVICAWDARVVVTLIEASEFDLLAVPTLGAEVRTRGLDWLHLPIRDVDVPDLAFEQVWPAHSAELRRRLGGGDNVLVHCRGGLGRAGMITARLLVEAGVEADLAIAAVRKVRPGAIETLAQEEWVRTAPDFGKGRRRRSVTGLVAPLDPTICTRRLAPQRFPDFHKEREAGFGLVQEPDGLSRNDLQRHEG
jgi:protein-tyrosine phosphatase